MGRERGREEERERKREGEREEEKQREGERESERKREAEIGISYWKDKVFSVLLSDSPAGDRDDDNAKTTPVFSASFLVRYLEIHNVFPLKSLCMPRNAVRADTHTPPFPLNGLMLQAATSLCWLFFS